MAWQVKLVTPLKIAPDSLNPFPQDYFPRRFAYKKDASECAKIVEKWGGKAEVTKVNRVGGQSYVKHLG